MKKGTRSKTHRGRPKTGLKLLSLRLTPDEYEALCRVAESECRSATAQAVWFIIQGLEGCFLMDLKKGDRIALVSMPEDPDPIPVGTKGTVRYVNVMTEYTQVIVDWDIQRSLTLVVPPDEVRRIDE